MGNIGNQVCFRLFVFPLPFNMRGQLLLHKTNAFRNMRQLSFSGNGNIRMKIPGGNLLYALCQSFNISCGFSLQKEENDGKNQNSHQYKKQNTDGADKGKALYKGVVISYLHQIIGVGTDI